MNRVILLGKSAEKFVSFLNSKGVETLLHHAPFPELAKSTRPEDFVVSYGYTHLLKSEHLSLFKKCPINLHISLLPWNRGSHPNVWSILEDTPKGITIHEMSAELDKGNILLQEEVEFTGSETLRSSYDILQKKIETRFVENWEALYLGTLKGKRQPPGGSYHRVKDLEKYQEYLKNGWDTPIQELKGLALRRA